MSIENQYEKYIEPYVCSFHKEHPNEDYGGCCCSSGFWMCRKGTNVPQDETVSILDLMVEEFKY